MTEERKQYLGDGAYVSFDGYAVVLTTEDGVSVTNRVVLEPQILSHFEEWVERLRLSVETPEQADCSACHGTGVLHLKTRAEPETKCDDCNGTGVEHGQ